MRILPLLLVFALAGPADAEVQTFQLRHSDTSVIVPGGTTTSLLDEAAPTAPIPFVEQQIIPAGTVASFPPFATRPFAADTPLLPIASVRLLLSANAKMRSCADARAEIFTVDAGGAMHSIGNGSRVDLSIAQGSSGGTVGSTAKTIEFAIEPTTVPAGHGLVLATSLGHDCGTNRRTFLAFDGARARSHLRFQCCFTTAVKCAARKLGLLDNLTKCLTAPRLWSLTFGDAVRPLPDQRPTCRQLLDLRFGQAERKGTCPTAGDGPAMTALADAFIGDLTADLDPLGPSRRNRCQLKKLRAARDSVGCLIKLEKSAVGKARFLEPDPLKAEKCRLKRALAFAKAEALGGCDTVGDVAAVSADVEAFVATATSRLACPCP